MIYFIIGLPGSGKTYWLLQLQKKLPFETIDLDEEIELQTKTTIPNLFKINETHFRQKESKILKSIIHYATSSSKNIIISTGGGTPCFYDNLKLMKNNGKVIFLKSSIKNIIKRIKNNSISRPLLPENENDLLEKLIELEKQRNSFYLKADIILDADHLTLPIFANILNSSSR